MADFLPDASGPTPQGAVPVDTMARRLGYLATRPAAWMGGADPYAAQPAQPQMTRGPQAAMAGPMGGGGISVGGGWTEAQPSLRARALQAQQQSQYGGGGGDFGSAQPQQSNLYRQLQAMGAYDGR